MFSVVAYYSSCGRLVGYAVQGPVEEDGPRFYECCDTKDEAISLARRLNVEFGYR